jgi:carbon-monoxide dehydrogenase small subunit
MILAAVSLQQRHPGATDDEIRAGLAGNLCRCTGYMKIFEAVRQSVVAAKPSGPVR